GPHLVVVPASLLENWQRELRRWCPGLKVVVYYGKHRAVVRKRLATLRWDRLDRGFLEKWRWSHLIMDEAHALKNRNASRTTRLRRVSNASRRRIMMTGTPLQNDLAELQNLLHFLLPSVFAA
ncbi:hypothetical protein CHLNCDRAFT_17545, partial [Chlorella variabilis]